MNIMFLNNTCFRCSFSSLDSRELTYVNFSNPSSTTVSRGSTTNESFSSALTWAETVVATRGCDLRGEDSLSSSPHSVLIWIVDSTTVRPSNCLEVNLPHVG